MTDDGLPEGVGRDCPWCGLLMICDDAKRTIHHPAPMCEGFTEAIKLTSGEKVGADPFCSVCRRTDVELRPYAKRGLPICMRCMTATPEREREARRLMRKALRRAGAVPVMVPGIGILSMEQAERLGLGDQLVYVDGKTGQVLDRGKS